MTTSAPPPRRELFEPTSHIAVPTPSSSCASSSIAIVSCPVPYSVDIFYRTTSHHLLHPEHSSPLILRTQVDSDIALLDASPPTTPPIPHFRPIRRITRHLLPRQPKRDAPLTQTCVFYRSEGKGEDETAHDGIVEYTSLVSNPSEIPFYHPKVKRLRFAYTSSSSPYNSKARSLPELTDYHEAQEGREDDAGPSGQLSVEISLFGSETPEEKAELLREEGKLFRICHNLLQTLWKNGRGTRDGYKSRTPHDIIIAKEPFQDLYLELKEKYQDLESRVLSEAKEGKEDVKRHVWKDISIATFLILLFKSLYPPIPSSDSGRMLPETSSKSATSEERSRWGAPRGGFVDLGCGNGLLTHILTSEGYTGKGLELRPRKTWSSYPPATQRQLHKQAIDPTELLRPYREGEGGQVFERETFFCGIHADEMTPWVPILAALTPDSAFLNIPCCLHTLHTRFTLRNYTIPPASHPPSSSQTTEDVYRILGGDPNEGGRYRAYLVWLAGLGWECGWEWEGEWLRIPSTRNYGVVGRRRLPLSPSQAAETHERVLGLIASAEGRFKARRAEGKAGDLQDEVNRRKREEVLEREGRPGWEGGGEAGELGKELSGIVLDD